MNPQRCSLLLLLHLSFITLLSSLPPSVAVDYTPADLYDTCNKTTPISCGNERYNISYPFNVKSRPDVCGRPGYNLTCVDESVLMLQTSGDKKYQVLGIDYSNRSLTIVDPSFEGDPCDSSSPFADTALDPKLFDSNPKIGGEITIINCTSTATALSSWAVYIAKCAYYDLYYSIGDGSVNDQSCKFSHISINETALQGLQSSSINFSEALLEGFTVTWTAGSESPCGDGCNKRGGICYYNEASKREECVCSDGLCSGAKGNKRHVKEITVGVAAASGFLLICAALLLYAQPRILHQSSIVFRSEPNNMQRIEAFLEENGYISPLRYKYSELKRMTESFHEKLGHGGYGTVYKGTLPDGRLVAVKMLNDSKGNGEEFINEVASIGRTSHVNVVRLLGFCIQGQKRALVYEFMSNGSLDKFICSEEQRMSIGWKRLHDIAVGIARGLEYLHRGCNTRIVHFDIKPHNILLDDEFCPKISDFGLAKLSSPKDSIISMVDARGTAGYIAPEVFCRNFGAVSTKSDVYSYGMMVLEMTGITKNPNAGDDNSSETYFPYWIYKQIEQDGNLQASIAGENSEIAKKLILVGLWCIQTVPANRPSIRRVIEMLEGKMDDIEYPPKPSYLSPPLLFVLSSSS